MIGLRPSAFLPGGSMTRCRWSCREVEGERSLTGSLLSEWPRVKAQTGEQSIYAWLSFTLPTLTVCVFSGVTDFWQHHQKNGLFITGIQFCDPILARSDQALSMSETFFPLEQREEIPWILVRGSWGRPRQFQGFLNLLRVNSANWIDWISSESKLIRFGQLAHSFVRNEYVVSSRN